MARPAASAAPPVIWRGDAEEQHSLAVVNAGITRALAAAGHEVHRLAPGDAALPLPAVGVAQQWPPRFEPPSDGLFVLDVKLRVAAELGLARMSLGRSVGLGPGAVIELDRAEGDPIDLVVNGRRHATGRLVLVNGGEWAVQVEEILAGAPGDGAAA